MKKTVETFEAFSAGCATQLNLGANESGAMTALSNGMSEEEGVNGAPEPARKRQLTLILVAVVAVASAVSHGLVAWLKIETTSGHAWQIGPPQSKTVAYLAGSSLSGDAIAWNQVRDALDLRLGGWGVAGSSPWEWEAFQKKASDSKLQFLVVSPYDLNEEFLCDFHADVVSPAATIQDLWNSKSDWHFCKRVLSGYPLRYVRLLFPTVGRSQGVMAGLRDKAKALLGHNGASDEGAAGPTLSFGKEEDVPAYKREKISSWDSARILRKLALMRNACQGRHVFNGPKNLAFMRMLQQGEKQGSVVVVVLPVSPTYMKEFMTPEVTKRYQEALALAQKSAPQTQWIRLDSVQALYSNELYSDFVHMNPDGKKIATEAFLSQLPALISSN
jgi:hypothetical protein